MYASIRRYTGVDPSLWDHLHQLRPGLETAFDQVTGFRFWFLVRTDEGLTTVTLCDDQAGAEASVQVAALWSQDTIPDLISGKPIVSNGDVALQIGD